MEAVRTNHQIVVDYMIAGQADFYRFAFSYVKNRDAALDVVQESIVKALSKSTSLREAAYIKTWFYRILINESMNYFRQGGRLVAFDAALDTRASPEHDPGVRLDLYDALDRLGEREQTIIRLRFFEDMKLEEIAHVTGTNVNTVKSRLYKGLKRLKELTGEEIEDE